MRDQYIFDIPVYRKTHDEFNNEIKTHVAKRVEWIVSHDPQRRPLSLNIRNRQLNSVIAESGGPWQFNQIVGWLRLFAEGYTIGCHLWWVDAQRLNLRMRQKRLYLTTSSDVLGAYFRKESSPEIFNRLLEQLTNMAAELSYKTRYVDLGIFRRVGPFIDWRKMLDQLGGGSSGQHRG